MQEDDALGAEQVVELRDLTLSSEEVLTRLKRSWPHIGVDPDQDSSFRTSH